MWLTLVGFLLTFAIQFAVLPLYGEESPGNTGYHTPEKEIPAKVSELNRK